MPSTRVAISGFGRLAREYYVPILRAIAAVTVVAVADPLEDSLRAATRLLPDVRTYSDVSEMCAKEDLDALLVASPPSSHLDAWRAAHENGITTFLEKPLGLISQLHALPHLNDAEARVMLNFNRRFWPAYNFFSEAAAAGRLGELQTLELVLKTNVRKWSTVTQHRFLPGEGGVLHDLGSQAIDIVCQVTDQKPTGISASGSLEPSGFEQIQLWMDFANGVRAHCKLGYGTENRECLIAVGTARSIVLREPNMSTHVVEHGTSLHGHQYLRDYAALGYRFLATRERMLYYTMSKALTQFIDALYKGEPQHPGYSEGVGNLRLLARAAETIKASPAQATHG